MDKKLAPEQRDEIMNHFDAIDVLEIQEFRMALLDFLNANTEEECDHVWDVPRVVCDKCRVVFGEHKPQLRED